MSFLVPLARDAGPLFRQVYIGLRDSILSGTLASGEQLPSTRHLAEQLGISRTVVLLAYEHLLAEGFVEGRHGSGTYGSQGVGGGKSPRAEYPARVRLARVGRVRRCNCSQGQRSCPTYACPALRFCLWTQRRRSLPF